MGLVVYAADQAVFARMLEVRRGLGEVLGVAVRVRDTGNGLELRFCAAPVGQSDRPAHVAAGRPNLIFHNVLAAEPAAHRRLTVAPSSREPPDRAPPPRIGDASFPGRTCLHATSITSGIAKRHCGALQARSG